MEKQDWTRGLDWTEFMGPIHESMDPVHGVILYFSMILYMIHLLVFVYWLIGLNIN